MAITASPVASSSGAAPSEPSVAATHLYADASCSSSVTRALLTVVLPPSPPPAPPVPPVPPAPRPGKPPVPAVPPGAPPGALPPALPRPNWPACPVPGNPPWPPGPPPLPNPPDGPAVGIAPLCAEPTVSSAYAAGPASPATMASPSGTTASASRPRCDRDLSHGPASTRPAAATPLTSTIQRRPGSQAGVRSCSTYA